MHLLLLLALLAPSPLDISASEEAPFHLHRKTIATGTLPFEEPRLTLTAAEMNRDGITDLIVLPRGAGQEYPARFLDAAYTRDSVSFLPGVAEDVASAPGIEGVETADAVFTVSGDTLWRNWNPDGEGTIKTAYSSAVWAGTDLRCVDAAAASPTERYVAVTSGAGPMTMHILFDDGATFVHAFQPFPVPGTPSDIRLLEFDATATGVPSHVAVLTTSAVRVFDFNGQEVLHVPQAISSWAVMGEFDDDLPDALALVQGTPGMSTVTRIHPVHGTQVTTLAGWTICSLDAGDQDDDTLSDLAYCTLNPTRWGVLHNPGWTVALDPADTIDVLNLPGAVVGTPQLLDHDGDEDLDLLVVAGGVLNVYLGGLPGEQSSYNLDVIGELLASDDPSETFEFRIYEPAALPPTSNEAVVAYRIHHQRPFNANETAAFVLEGDQPVTGSWPVRVEVTLPAAPDELDVFYLEFFVIDRTEHPWEAYPVSDYAWTALPNGNHDPRDPQTWGGYVNGSNGTGSQLGAVCSHIGMTRCLPKDSVGIIRIPFIPPPITPGL